jgi:hypothetical protein
MALTTTSFAPASQAPARVRILRAVLIQGVRNEPGSEITVPLALAQQMVGANQAVRLPDAPAAQEAPAKPTTQSHRAAPKE